MSASPPRPRVAVVFGGRSSEHSISCVSAAGVLRAIDRDVYDVVPLGISPAGRWMLVPDDPGRLEIVEGKLPQVDEGYPVVLAGDPTVHALTVMSQYGSPTGALSQTPRVLAVTEDGSPTGALGTLDVVFPLLHGPYGEDGTIQGLLELSDIPYVGSGVLASAMAMDKAYMKVALAAAGLPVGPYLVVPHRRWHLDPAGVRADVARLGLPLFVKPARGGSSVGISKVSGPDGLDKAIADAQEWDPKVIVEAALPGREIECGVLEGRLAADGSPTAPEASVTAEIRVTGGREFYDFEAKYLENSTELTVPAALPTAVAEEVRRLSVLAFEALSCEGLARVDFFVDSDRIVINEVNTMPGFTPVSMFPSMWAASGVDYRALVDRLLRTALARRRGLR